MYEYLLAPLLAWGFALILKFILKNRYKNLKFRDFFAYSSMPSGHTALVVALSAIIFLKDGIGSPLFAVSAVFASVVVTDAVGLRTYLGQHGKTLNVLVKDLKEDQFIKDSYPELLEQIGHTQMEALVGGLIGLAASLIIWLM
ncbi:MAG: divergent PAP2 family protein [Candidatus Falkowbacteria bacterium]|nr:divergent PAP2 family protein [Candidatus Falkowbacteria bacterium]